MLSKVVLAGLQYISCEIYIDDVIVYGDSLDELTIRFREILTRFKKFNIVVNPDKCCFGLSEIEFLGHVVSKDGIRLGKKKVDGLMKIQEPQDRIALKSFLGLTNYFREFIPYYADKILSHTAPINSCFL